jgi:hypothetical protein
MMPTRLLGVLVRRVRAYVAGRKLLPCSIGPIEYKARFQ